MLGQKEKDAGICGYSSSVSVRREAKAESIFLMPKACREILDFVYKADTRKAYRSLWKSVSGRSYGFGCEKREKSCVGKV